MNHHTRTDSDQVAALTPDFIDGYAVVGPPDECIERLARIEALGISKAIVIGPSIGSDRDVASASQELMRAEIIPAIGGVR